MAGNDPVPARKWIVIIVLIGCLVAAYLCTKG